MFKNRALQVKMVKNDKNEPTQPDTVDQLDEKALIIGVHIQSAITTVGKVVLAYIAADTIRQVIVNQTK